MSKNWKNMVKKVFSKDQELEREQQDFQKTYRLLLLGTKESGKSTMMKQMRLLYGAGFSELERKALVYDIRMYLKDAIQKITTAMYVMVPNVEFASPENCHHSDYINKLETHLPNGDTLPDKPSPDLERNFNFTEEFWSAVDSLWRDNGVQRAYQRANEYQLMDSAKYFLDRMHQVKQPDYLPSDQDILRIRVQTTKSMETIFTLDSVRFHMFDVAGQRDQKGKWLQCFNNITAILFIVPTSGYDVIVEEREDEESGRNRLAESLDVFTMLWNSKWLTRKSVILFLNKMDQLHDKVTSGQSKLETFFPEFRNYTTPSFAVSLPEDNPEVVRAKYFIRNEITKITAASNTQHTCYPHFTTAVDMDIIHRVFNDCREIIHRTQLQQGVLL